MPETETAPSVALAGLAVAFSAQLRADGLDIPISAVITYRRALEEIAGFGPNALYWAGRASFVHGPDDVAAYDKAYASFFLGQVHHQAPFPVLQVIADDEPDDDAPGAGSSEPSETGTGAGFTAREVLREKDFGELSSAELAEAHRMMAELRLVIAARRTHRWHQSRGQGERPDLRQTFRHSLPTGGELIDRAWRQQRLRPRRIVVLVDVSGSMEPYVKELIRFVHAAVAGRAGVEAFALGTRLTRLTRDLSSRDPQVALDSVARHVPDWSGGTRLGEGLQTFNERFGVKGMARESIVLICSDGVDRGDPALLGREMERLHRVAYRVVWVNPLKASPGYAPIARGMAAALPFVDDFVPGHSVGALVALARSIVD